MRRQAVPEINTARAGSLWIRGAALLMGAALASPCLAEVAEGDQSRGVDFFEEREDGWFWYEDPPSPPGATTELQSAPRPAPAPAPASESAAPSPAPMSAEWMRTMLPQLRDTAIDQPTRENVRAYYYAQRIMMDKAQVFSDVAQQVVRDDPLLDENLRLPFAAAAKVSFLESANDAKRQIVDDLRDEAGLWFFYDATCAYCDDQIAPINELAKRHDVVIEAISRHGDKIPGLDPSIQVRRATGQFETLGINFTPAVMLVAPPDGYYLISQGFTSYTMLVDRIIAAANQYGFVDQETYYAAVPTAKGVLRADQLEGPDGIDWDDGTEWVPFVRKQIAETYGIELPSEEDDDED